jgi:D-xylose 1-dehydrogenase (NADP+, D-xylono-1,5-lactone-forming)
LRLGIIGCGGISERHARGAAQSDEVDIVACCDVRLEAALDWARSHGCERAYGDYRTMLREHELDGVILATWPNQHHEHILGCLEAGARAILCEKSLTLTGAEALDVWSAATAEGALVAEAYMYRHHPAFRLLEEVVASGEVGDVDTVRAAFSLFDPAEAGADDVGREWRQQPELGGGVPWDLAGYCVDACNRFAASPPLHVAALASRSERYGTIDRLFGLIEYANGRVGIVESSKRSDFDHELRIDGSHGHALLDVAWRIEGDTRVQLARSTGWGVFETRRIPVAATDPYRLQLEQFARAARGETAAMPSLPESVVTAFTLDALLVSAAERTVVTVEVPDAVAA